MSVSFLATIAGLALLVSEASAGVGSSGSGLARAHIYYAGDYGSCGYQAQTSDETGPCGTSSDNPCISTSLQDGGEDCGKCFKVTMPKLGTTTYIKIVDTDGSDASFEMTLPSWKNLCPQACLGYGVCEAASKTCEFGTVPVEAVQSEQVTWEQYDCGSGDTNGEDNNNGNNDNNSSNGNNSNNDNNSNSNGNDNNNSNGNSSSGSGCCLNTAWIGYPGMQEWCDSNGCVEPNCHPCGSNESNSNNSNNSNSSNSSNNSNNSNNSNSSNNSSNSSNNSSNNSNNSNNSNDSTKPSGSGSGCCLGADWIDYPGMQEWCDNNGCVEPNCHPCSTNGN